MYTKCRKHIKSKSQALNVTKKQNVIKFCFLLRETFLVKKLNQMLKLCCCETSKYLCLRLFLYYKFFTHYQIYHK